jgi:hypothetical protein
MPRALVKTWVKVGDIQQYVIVPVEERELVYSNNIKSIEDYPKLMERLEPERNKLSNRREAKSGVIRWFDLQWSRNNELFDGPKLLCRFKAPFNTFALDLKGTYSSADTTVVKIKNEWTNKIDLYYLLAVLNSNVLDFYFKSYGKLMDYRYEYYPGPVSLLPIRMNLDYNEISTLVQELMIAIADSNSILGEKLKSKIQKSIYRLYNLTEEEIKIVEESSK